MKKRTKIVATISDMKSDVSFLKELYAAGMDVVRINTAHQGLDDTLKVIKSVREVSEKIPILIDTKGPEIRTTKVEAPIQVATGEKIFVKGGIDQISSRECLYLSYNKFADEVPVGCSVLIDDGEMELAVIGKEDGKLVCEVRNGGAIKGRKSVNVPGVAIDLPSLSQKDLDYIDFVIEHDVEFIAHSFVRHRKDVTDIQDILKAKNSKAKIIAKIESQQGVDNIDEILDVAYGVMIARGDLGIEVPAERLPGIQNELIRKCVERKKPVIVATQMLHTMIENPRPTRAEVSDIANAIYRGTDAIMLSGETAYGKYPLEAVKTMTRIANEVEQSQEVRKRRDELPVAIDGKISVLLAQSAIRASKALPTKAIILDTTSGKTARYVAAFRGTNFIYAVCFNKRVMRELALSYGVYAEYMERRTSTDAFEKDVVKRLHDTGNFNPSDLIIFIGGSFGPEQGATFLEINSIEHILNLDMI